MKIMVTGGSGFIGKNFIHYMMDKYSVDIVNIDHTWDDFNGKVEMEWCDIRFPNSVLQAMLKHRPTYIVNFAAESHVDTSISSSHLFSETNVVGVSNLLEASRRVGGVKRFVQISTDEVFGSIPYGSTDEDAPYRPRNPYSASKAGAEHLVYAFRETHGTDAVVTRCTNNYGKYQASEKFIPNAVTRLAKGEPIRLYGTGSQSREWTNVLDHCRAIEKVMYSTFPGFSVNVPGGLEITNYELARMICLEMGKDPDEWISFVEDRKGHDMRYSLTSKYYNGIDPDYTPKWFKVGLQETIEYYKTASPWEYDHFS